jgi:hypothetical protein
LYLFSLLLSSSFLSLSLSSCHPFSVSFCLPYSLSFPVPSFLYTCTYPWHVITVTIVFLWGGGCRGRGSSCVWLVSSGRLISKLRQVRLMCI